ncbi:efflux RND transporter periplasmic adaptor subunit [Aureispira anguillae]|uniref:Efflux RND transporter periplasmic adaptor subunit n=1 Tax=Aureispira anguillae TaxID=2864201 RepID=A0A915YLL1_9BACT|nr:efflux RND transporter periplasmic adaptor subunit [Aureispira anguillae]BDS15259.1 efflux RND transporter periplasmic adaptor subunit [Aureispira anguillae]
MANKRKSRKGLYLLLVVIIIIAVGGYYQFNHKKENPERVAVEAAQKRTIVETVYSSGKLFPATELEITSNISGTIIELYVKEGDLVKKGQLLAKVDPEALVSIVERAEAATEGSKAQLEAVRAQKKQLEAQFENTRIIYTRNKELYKDGVISKSEFEAAEATFNTSKANIEAAVQNILAAEYTVKSSEATVKEQKKNLSQTRIYAPISGVVSTLYKKQGEQVVGTAQMAGTPILKIANLKTVEVRVDVNERDILTTSIGDSAEIELDAYPDRKFLGIVTQIANTATGLSSLTAAAQLTSDQVTNFEVRILMLDDSYKDLDTQSERSPFRAGLSASAEIKTNTAESILSVPVAAVTTREEEVEIGVDKEAQKIKEYVFVQVADSVLLREVTTGIQNDNFIEIKSGLKAGEVLVKAPYDAISKLLEDGSKIKVVEEKALYQEKEKES